MHLAPRGVYDADKQLSGEQILAMKNRFKETPDLIGKVAMHIVDGFAMEAELLECEEPWFDTREEFEEFKSETTRQWNSTLFKLVDLPGEEWPDGVTPPATFAEALKELDAQSERGSNNG